MITIFANFIKKLAPFLKKQKQFYDHIFAKTSISLSKKRKFFRAKFFGRNILKILTSVPGHPDPD
jgi:hypothetical protein